MELNMKFGFLEFTGTEAGDGYFGAIMVTDSRGVPLEFRCTRPVKPSMVQRTLYGNSLGKYVAVSLCGTPLIAALENKPDFLFIRSKDLSEVDTAGTPLILIQSLNDTLIEKKSESDHSTVITFEGGDLGTFKFFVSGTKQSEITGKHVEEMFGGIDPFEPFERMTKAFGVLSKQDNKFL
jgi:hypothetical protein